MNTFRTAKHVIENLRKEAKKKYDNKLDELRKMESILQKACPHRNIGTYSVCLDCGKVL